MPVAAFLYGLGNLATGVLAVQWCVQRLKTVNQSFLRLKDEVEHHGLHDSLTGLANRGFFMDQLVRRTALAERRSHATFAVFCLDIEGFRQISERLDRGAADRVLVKVGDVLRSCVRSSDLVARMGGDSFAILIEELAEPRDVAILAQRIQSAVPEAVAQLEADFPVSVNIGIAFKSPAHSHAGDILREADQALRLAKSSGPGHYQLTG